MDSHKSEGVKISVYDPEVLREKWKAQMDEYRARFAKHNPKSYVITGKVKNDDWDPNIRFRNWCRARWQWEIDHNHGQRGAGGV